MGKCEICGKKLLYNRFKRYRKQILCYDCYDTRLERKKQKKEKMKEAELNAKETQKKAQEFGLITAEDAPLPKEEGNDDDQK